MNIEYKICNLSQSREEYICTNEQCIKQKKFKLCCHQCITQQHRQEKKKNLVNHIDDFCTASNFLKDYNLLNNYKLELLNQSIKSCEEFKKEKKQQIELLSFNSIELIQQVNEHIEKEVDLLIKQFVDQYGLLSNLQIYRPDDLQLMFKFKQETQQLFYQNITNKRRIVENNINDYIQQMDLDLRSTILLLKSKQKELENSISHSNNNIYNKKGQFNISIFGKLLIMLLLTISLTHIYILRQEREETNLKFKHIQQQMLEMKNELQIQISNIHVNQETKFNQFISTIQELQDKVDQTEIPFNKFKTYFSNKLTNYNETVYNSINKNYSLKQEQDNLNKEFIIQIEQLRDKINLINNQNKIINNLQHNITILEIFQNETKNNLLNSQRNIQNIFKNLISLNQHIEIPERQEAINSLVGKIHVDLSFNKLNGFIIIFEQLFNQPFNRAIVNQIKKIINESTILCIGGIQISNVDIIPLIACDYANEIFEFTYHWQFARKSKNGNIYWYMAHPVAFGFSPTEQIHLTLCDDLDPNDQRRFSYWFENGNDGGRRIGNQTQLINSIDYKMVIYAI